MNGAKILVVDDEDIVCKSCDRLLSEEGFEVDTSRDPREGLLIAQQNPYDIILVDLKMPGLNGIEFLRAETGCDVSQIAPDALSLLVDYDWPGNVRELENVIHRAVVLARGNSIISGQLPPEIRDVSSRMTVFIPRTSEELKQRKKELRERAVDEVERRFVTEALKRSEGNVTRAAAEVEMQRSNFQALMRKHSVEPNPRRSLDVS